MNSGNLNILLTDGKLFTKTLDNTIISLQWCVLHMLADHHIDTKLVQSIWFQPEPQQITLEDLDLKA